MAIFKFFSCKKINSITCSHEW